MAQQYKTTGLTCPVHISPSSSNPPASMIEHPAIISVYEEVQSGKQTWYRISEGGSKYEQWKTDTLDCDVYTSASKSKPPVSRIEAPATITAYEKKAISGKTWFKITEPGKSPEKWVINDVSGKTAFKLISKPQHWVPAIAANGDNYFTLYNPKPEFNDNTSNKNQSVNDKKVTHYYIGTDWTDGKAIKQESSAFVSLDAAISYYENTLRDQVDNLYNYKVFDSKGEIVYHPSEQGSIQLMSISEESSLQDNINWSDIIDLYKENDLDSQYASSIDSLTIKNLTGVMGLPYQWLPSQDPRLNSGGKGDPGKLEAIGRVYGDKILTQVPLLLITPGVPDFMRNFTDDEASNIMTELLNKLDRGGQSDSKLQDFIKNSGKYYSLSFDYANYYQSVNAMCRSAAYFLDIQDTVVNGHKLGTYDQNADYSRSELDKFLSAYNGCIPFYVDSENSIQDSFGNDTTQSQLADTINGYSAMANEVNYITGNTKMANAIDDIGDTLTSSIETMTEHVDKLLGGSNLITSIGGGLEAILNGGKLIFPEIWSDSSFSRSYDVTVKLVTPDNDKLSWYLNIWVPLAHLMGLVLPRQSTVNGYISPFIIRAFYKGLFNVDMGIITNMSVQKGGDGLWSRDGLPSSVEVTFTIKDLYNYMSLSNPGENVMNNITLLDYIGNSCGVNINEVDIVRNVQMYLMIGGYGRAKDFINHGIFSGLDQWLTNKIQSIFGFF